MEGKFGSRRYWLVWGIVAVLMAAVPVLAQSGPVFPSVDYTQGFSVILAAFGTFLGATWPYLLVALGTLAVPRIVMHLVHRAIGG